MSEQSLGRIGRANLSSGTAEFSAGVRKGDILYFLDDAKKKILVRVTRVRSRAMAGVTGNYQVIQPTSFVPVNFAPLYEYVPEAEEGAYVELGTSSDNQPLLVRINNLFKIVLVAGKTQQGKTELTLGIAEQLVVKRVPHLVIDSHGEFTNLPEFDGNAVILEETEEILAALQKRKTIIFNLIEYANSEKTERMTCLLSALKEAKEKDYAQAGQDLTKLKYPPVLITVDEAEIYAPCHKWKSTNPGLMILIEYAKRQVKFGLGLILVSQQVNMLHHNIRSQCNSAILFLTDDSSGLGTIRNLSYVTNHEVLIVRSLHERECVVIGAISPQPTVVTIRPIQTARTKSTDFEALLGLRKKTVVYESNHREPASKKYLEDLADATNVVCGDCHVSCQPILTSEKGTGSLKHLHWVCPKCREEYCTLQKRWIKPVVKVE